MIPDLVRDVYGPGQRDHQLGCCSARLGISASRVVQATAIKQLQGDERQARPYRRCHRSG